MARARIHHCARDECGVMRAYYGPPRTKDGLYCFKHKKKKMIKLFNVCAFEDCGERFRRVDSKTGLKYCIIHKTKDCILIADTRKCQCSLAKQPVFNFPEETFAICCNACKKPGMVNVKDRKCINCHKTRPNYSIDGSNNKLYCRPCADKLGTAKLIGVKMCETCEEKQATYGSLKEGKRRFCSKDKKEGMILIYGNFCKECKDTIAIFGYPGDKIGSYCKKHMKNGMIDIKNTKCITCVELKVKLPIQPRYNLPGQKSGKYCFTHKLTNMINVVAKRCKVKNCNIQVTSNRYNDYCYDCFREKFPKHKINRYFLIKERNVVKYIKKEFGEIENIELCYNQILKIGKITKRPDIIIKLANGSIIIIEIDEYQHKSYNKYSETIRHKFIRKALNNVPIVFIRFNPDDYINDDFNKVTSPWKIVKNELKIIDQSGWNARLEKLSKRIRYWFKRMPSTGSITEYIYFDSRIYQIEERLKSINERIDNLDKTQQQANCAEN